MHSYSRTPVVSPQCFTMINQLPESEPFSEYTEVPMLSPRAIPGQFHQTSTQASPRRLDMTPRRHQEMVASASPYSRPAIMHLLPPPSPQCFHSPYYNPNQSFIMRPMSSTSTPMSSPTQPKNPVNTSVAVVKPNPGTSQTKKSSQKTSKLNSVSRQIFLIGSLDQVVRWHKMAREIDLYTIYECTGVLERLTKSTSSYRMILRSEEKNSPPLQAIFYLIDRELPPVRTGELITCMGRMVGANKLQVYNMWPTSSDSLVGLKRISFLCQRNLQEAHLATPEP